MAKTVNPRIEGGQTSQGFYVAHPGGASYGFNNNRSVERVHGLLDKGLAGFRKGGPATVAKPAADSTVPADVSVMRVFARVRPVPEGAAASNNNVARDHLWIYPDELKAIAGGQGSVFPLPSALGKRIARFHLVDNVRGEPDMWNASDIRAATFNVRPEDGGYRLQGKFTMGTSNGARGMEGSFEGWLEIDKSTWKVKRFLALANSSAWGRGTYTPNQPEGKFSMVFAMLESNDAVARRVPPQGLMWGQEYRGK